MKKLPLITLFYYALFAQTDLITEERQKAITQSRAIIKNECEVATQGDWSAWHESLSPYRKELNKSFEAAQKKPFVSRRDASLNMLLVSWRSDPGHLVHANTLLSIASAGEDLDAYLAADRLSAIAVGMTKWFKARGVDLIFVPVPTKAEIYPEELVADGSVVPKDRNVIPHMRRKLLRMLEEGVEVVDLYPGFMKLRKEESDCLFMAADKHWRATPQKFAAEQIAARLGVLRCFMWVRLGDRACRQ